MINRKKLIFAILALGAIAGGSTLTSPLSAQTTQPAKTNDKRTAQQAKKQAEADRKAAEIQRKTDAAAEKAMLKMRDAISTNGVGEKALLEVQLRDGTRVKGWVSQLSMNDFTVHDAAGAQTRTIAYREVAKAKGKNPAAKKKGGGGFSILDALP